MTKNNNVLMMVVMGILFMVPLLHAQDDGKQAGESQEQGSFDKIRERNEKRVQELFTQLNLTEEQKKQIDENKAMHSGGMKGSFQQQRLIRQALKDELMKETLDMDKVNEIQQNLKNMQAKMADEHLNSILRVRNILTHEQFVKFLGLMEEQKRRWHDKKNKDVKEEQVKQ